MNQYEPSLLSHLNDIRKSTTSDGGLSSIIFCGKLRSEGDLAEVLQVHRKIVEDEVNEEEVSVTGILMGQGNCILHLLEGPSFSVLRILKRLAEHSHFIKLPTIQTGTVVYSVEDRPKRYFPEWYSCIIQERKSQTDEINAENCKDIVFELANRLLEIGKCLQSESSEEELDLSRYADQLPGKNLILSLSTAPNFFTLEDFVQFYFDPYHIELDSEQIWPLERLVNYC